MDAHWSGYRLLARAAGGSTAASPDAGGVRVWRAERESDGGVVAIKVFPPEFAERASREAEITAAIAHPHVPRLLDVLNGEGGTGLVFDWCAGGSLADLLALRLRLRWPEALTVLIPLTDALTAAHERGLVHGDISPANVLFDDVGRPMLADFGAARAAMERGGEVCATPTDVAPEIVRGAAPNPATDLFSLGSVALACLCGHGAWPADDLQDVLIQSTAGQWPDVPEHMAPPALCTVVRRLLAPEPADRGSAAQAAVDLRRVGEPEPVALPTTGSGDDPVAAAAALRPATMVRPDAVRPPATTGRPASMRNRWLRAARPLAAHLSLRGTVAVTLALALVVAAVVVGRWWGSGPAVAAPSPPTRIGDVPSVSVPVDGVDWAAVVGDLDRARSEAFTSRDISRLDAVYAPGVAERAEDERRIASLIELGVAPTDATHRIRSARLVDRHDDGSVSIVVVETQAASALRRDSGVNVPYRPPNADSTVVLRLATTADGFRIVRIEPG